jgi:hypothetical protein
VSITLKQITQRAGGGDITRTHELASAEPVIGRSTECDIQLPDLAVSLTHASLQQVGPDRVRLEALKGFSFDINGKQTTQAELQIAANPQAVFGSHTLEFSTGDAPEEVVVTVTRIGVEQDSGIDTRRGVFSLQSAVVSRRTLAYTLVAAIFLLCLIVPIAAFYVGPNWAMIDPDQQWSSGPLSVGHAFLENDCQSCHQQAFVAVRDATCLTCHQSGMDDAALVRVANDVEAAGSPFAPRPAANHAENDLLLRAKPASAELGAQITAFIQRSFNHPSERCSDCHAEHVGFGSDLALPASAPLPIHAENITLGDCTDCHGAMAQRLEDTAFLDVPDWEGHPEFNANVTIAIEDDQPVLQRIALSQSPTENNGLTFPHDLHNSATGGVARMAIALGEENGYGAALDCGSCHRPDEKYRGFLALDMERDCAACHSLAYASNGEELQTLPHGEPERVVTAVQEFYASTNFNDLQEYLSRRRPGNERTIWTTGLAEGPFPTNADEMIDAVFSEGGSCFGCHATSDPDEAGTLNFDFTPVQLTERYLPFGDFDHGVLEHHEDENGNATCLNCHVADSSETSTDVMLPGISECHDCHGAELPFTAAAAPVSSITAHPESMPASAECTQCHGYHATSEPVVSFRERN